MPRINNEMVILNTPIERYKEYGLWVKREDKACKPPGPPFSKTRGVFSHLMKTNHDLVGVLDTYHSQAGWAVARACQLLGRECVVFYPEFKHEPGYRFPQEQAKKLGATLQGLPAGRSAILFHQARKLCEAEGGYMMPNALKLTESINETAKEVPNQLFDYVIIPASSATIAAGVIMGFTQRKIPIKRFIVHLGYSRSEEQVRAYLKEHTGATNAIQVVDEGYNYKDVANPGDTPPWPCNPWYDLKSFRWYLRNQSKLSGRTLFWNIG